MSKIIVSDASPLIALAKLECLELLLALFSEVHIPHSVYLEATCARHRRDAQLIDDFVQQNVVVHNDQTTDDYKRFRSMLDEGESQALRLAAQLQCAILIDERLGRAVAKQQSIPVVGVMGVLLEAKTRGKIDALRPLIEQLLDNGYRLSERVIEIVLKRAGEN